MTQHERTLQDLQKINDLLAIIDTMYDIAFKYGDTVAKVKANDLLSNALEISSGRYYTNLKKQ